MSNWTPRTQDEINLENRLFFIREARRRGNSKWSRDFWTTAEQTIIRRYNRNQLLRGLVDDAKLVQQ